MKFTSVLQVATLAALVAADFDLSQWNLNDIKQFLRDRKVEFADTIGGQDLSKLANEEFLKLKDHDRVKVDINDKNKQHILKLATDPDASINDVLPHHNWDYLVNNENKVKDWIFESWSYNSLKKYLKSNKVKVGKNLSKQELVDLAKEHYDAIAKKNEVSGNYPGDWLYSSWSIDDIRDWLESFEIPFDAGETKDSLLEKVKDFNFVASLTTSDSKNSLLDSLNLFEKPIFDAAGHIKKEFYDTWTYSQLREWLYSQGIIDTKPGVYIEDLNIDKLKKLVASNEKLLVKDIKSWLDQTKAKYADPLLSKVPAKYENIINNTFLVGIENWTKDKLREFLKVRDVKASQFLTKSQLIELVKKNINTPVIPESASNSYSWLVDNLSTENLKEWLKEQGQNIDGTRQDLLAGLSKYLESSTDISHNSVKSQIKNYTPDLESYKKWVKANAKNADSLSEEAILSTYNVVTEYFNSASSNIDSKYKEAKFSVNDALNEIQKASYQYSLDFLNDYESNKNNIKQHLESAKIAANDFSNDISDALVRGAEHAQGVAEGAHNHITAFTNYVLALFHKNKEPAKEAAASAYQSGKEFASQAAEAGAEFTSQAGEHAQYAYSAGSEYSNQAKEQAAHAYEVGGEYASKAKDQASSAYEAAQDIYQDAEARAVDAHSTIKSHVDSATPIIKSKYTDASKAASSAYDEYKPVLDEKAHEAYEAAKDYSQKAQEGAQHVYSESKPVLESTWNYLVDTYNNADLKSYLQSYGFDHDWLSSLSRFQLIKLANEQSRLFYGNPKTKWDKSIVEVLSDTSDDVQRILHLKKEEPTLWQRIKTLF